MELDWQARSRVELLRKGPDPRGEGALDPVRRAGDAQESHADLLLATEPDDLLERGLVALSRERPARRGEPARRVRGRQADPLLPEVDGENPCHPDRVTRRRLMICDCDPRKEAA